MTLPEPRQDNCPTPENVCSLYHPGSVPLAYCLGTDCFDMNYGTEVRVVAGDDGGAYPRRWFVWGVAIEDVTYTSCVLADSGNKLRVDLPEGKIRCRLSFAVGASIYHHHFAANPASQCVGWGECGYPGDRARQRD